jgi:rhamnopyranosyl-N-acetylglucosaminyl-diphospho-decaprenol beta-1,3/1,4-galactofuranosyltransferase
MSTDVRGAAPSAQGPRDHAVSESIAAVVVTYNRKALLCECLDALLKQTRPLDAIYVIDNASTDGTRELLDQRGYLRENKIRYVGLSENTGGAGGFHEGMSRAYNDDYDWIWVMDDDVEPEPQSLEAALTCRNEPDVVAIVSRQIDLGRWFDDLTKFTIGPLDAEFPVLSTATFAGTLIKYTAIRQIGLPRKEFFIHNDDTEFAIRLRSCGRILLSPKSVVLHKAVARKQTEVKLWGRLYFQYDIVTFCFQYFRQRNLVWTRKHHTRNPIALCLWITSHFVRQVLRVILIDKDYRWARIRVIAKAHCDALFDNFDNDFPARFAQHFRKINSTLLSQD